MNTNPPPILILRKGSVTNHADISAIRKAGILVLEVSNPSEVRFIDAPIAKGNLARLADAMVRKCLSENSSIYRHQVLEKMSEMIMAAELPLSVPPAQLPEDVKP